jgi:hypothetical protein
LKEQLVQGIKNGSFEAETVSINFEMSVLPQWQSGELPNHVRLEVNEITAGYGD